jgi:hypothetical protein
MKSLLNEAYSESVLPAKPIPWRLQIRCIENYGGAVQTVMAEVLTCERFVLGLFPFISELLLHFSNANFVSKM